MSPCTPEWHRRHRRMMFSPILQNGIPQGTYNLIGRLACMIRDLVERGMMEHRSIADVERAVQVIFRNMVYMRDHMNGHPGVNGIHILCFDRTILSLEILCCLEGICTSKSE